MRFDASPRKNASLLPYIINLGAHCSPGVHDAVASHMVGPHVHGFALDADDPMLWAGANIAKHTGFVTPDTIASLLDKHRVPPEPRLLKVDIDGFDVDVALAVLRVRLPHSP